MGKINYKVKKKTQRQERHTEPLSDVSRQTLRHLDRRFRQLHTERRIIEQSLDEEHHPPSLEAELRSNLRELINELHMISVTRQHVR